jgi:hypothetical protein
MNIDDEKAKIRRNLVLFCSLYLSSAYLGLSAQDVLSQWLSLKGSVAVSSERLMGLSTVVFAYLAWRWFTSDEQRGQYAESFGSFTNRLISLLNKRVNILAEKQKFDSTFNFFSEVERIKFTEWMSSSQAVVNPFTKFKSAVHSYNRSGVFSGTWILDLRWLEPDGEAKAQQFVNFKMSPSASTRLGIFFESARFTICRPAFAEWLPPFFLTIITTFVIAYRYFDKFIN